MTATTEDPAHAPAAPAVEAVRAADPSACQQCGGSLADDQEWCLECGAARTLIHRAPDWRVPVAVIGSVIVLVLAGFAIALINLSINSNRSSNAVATTPAAAASAPAPPSRPAAPAAKPRPVGHAIASWAVGLPGWTVVLAARRRRAAAFSLARRLASAGLSIGVLHSSDHPGLIRGWWIVFSGRYPTDQAARTEAQALIARGYSHARVRQVGRPGG